MIVRIVRVTIVILLATGLSAQCPPVLSVLRYSTQSAIDSFRVRYPDCSDFATNSLVIEGSDINSLQPLLGANFREVSIINTSLVDLKGLDSIESVRNLGISDNAKLISLAGLESLMTVRQGLGIRDNPLLEGYGSLPSLDTVGLLLVPSDSGLKDFSGLEQLRVVYDFQISHDISLEGLSSLRQVYNFDLRNGATIASIREIIQNTDLANGLIGELEINTALAFDFSDIEELGPIWCLRVNTGSPTDLAPLRALDYCLGLAVSGDSTLTVLNSLEGVCLDYLELSDVSIESLDGPVYNSLQGLSLTFCPQLNDISALEVGDSLRTAFLPRDYGQANFVVKSALQIRECPQLTDCAVEPICQRVETGAVRPFHIQSNAAGCSSVEEVEVLCQAVMTQDQNPSSVAIYPNPARDRIYLRGTGDHPAWRLTDLSGRVLQTGSSNMIDLTTRSSGIYLLTYCTGADGRFATQKVMKL